ncbi:MAG: hypothetical protein ACTHJ5_14330 [Ilyomonas sp.]
MLKKVSVIAFLSFLYVQLHAQDTLPNFTVKNVGKNKVSIGWINPFGAECIQLNVQRSYDSTKGFRTIFSTTSPELPQNGFVDQNAFGNSVYYRIFFILNNNAYFFSKAKKASSGYENEAVANNLAEGDSITIKAGDSTLTRLSFNDFNRFRDSILANTKDSLFAFNATTILLKPYIPTLEGRPSTHFFVDRTGTIRVNIPKTEEKRYSLTVFEADGKTELFNIKHFPDSPLMLDKTNFIHAGWFVFDLMEDGKLKERNKIFIQKEF